jgi:HAMP domain-containing protein
MSDASARPRIALGLAARVFTSTVVIVGAVVAAALFIGSASLRRADDEANRRGLDQSADIVAQLLVGRERNLAGGARVFVQQPYFRTLVSERRRDDLVDQSLEAATQLGAHWVMITDQRGILLAKSDEPLLAVDSLGSVPLVSGALAGGATSGFGVSRDTLLFQAVGLPIVIPGRAPVGALVATRIVDSVFASDVKAAAASELVFFARDGAGDLQVVASTLGRDDGVLAAAELMAQKPAGRTSSGRVVAIHGIDYFAQTSPLTTAGGDVVGGFMVLRSRHAAATGESSVRFSLVIAAALGLLLAIVSAFVSARRIARPLRALSSVVHRAADGDYDAVVGVRKQSSGDSEVDALAVAFESLLADLRDKESLVTSVMGALGTSDPPTRDTSDRGHARVLRLATDHRERRNPASLASGIVLAERYEIERMIGSGGIGVVYKAIDRVIGEPVALKVLRPEIAASDADAIERFRDELRLARRVSHRNVVRTHDIGEDAGITFLTMEFVEGSSLARLIVAGGVLAPDAIVSIAKQLMRALVGAHDQGVMHGDIKPQNLLISPSGVLKVTDFGVARLVRARQGAKVVNIGGAVVGTPEYMAPELLLGGEATPRSDLYAAGVVLHECLRGQTPYSADTPTAFMAHKFMDRRTAALRLEPTLGSITDLENLVRGMTSAAPADRPLSALAVLDILSLLG